MTPLLALNVGAWGLSELIVAVIIIAALIAILWIAVRAMGMNIPQWAVQIFWVVVIAIVAIVAIKIILSL